MAYGLPVEGDDGPFVGGHVAPVPTCDVALTVADARRVMEESGADVVVLVHGEGVVVGDVDRELVSGEAGEAALLDVLRPVPSTVRPSVTVASVAEAGGGRRLVTSADGRLCGVATVEGDADAHAHHGHDHDDHAAGGSSVDVGAYEEEVDAVMRAVGERFGDREPSAEELREFLRERLVGEGLSSEEAQRLLADMERR